MRSNRKNLKFFENFQKNTKNFRFLKKNWKKFGHTRSRFHVFFSLVVISDMENGLIGDMSELGITESFQVKRQVIVSASEAAEMIIRVDDIIKATPRQRGSDQCH